MQKPEETTPGTQKQWEALAKRLVPEGVELGAMFGMPALKFGGKAFGGRCCSTRRARGGR